jgi:hypothetical protein
VSDPATTFRRILAPSARPLFDDLKRHVHAAKPGLAWHYRLGRLVARLRAEVGAAGGTNWLGRLADSVEYAPSSVLKHLKVAKTLTAADVRVLSRANVPWTHVANAVHLPDRILMKALLVQAARECWGVSRVRGEVVKLGGGSRRRYSGRRPSEPRSFGPVVDLDRLIRDCRAWRHAHEVLWAPGRPALSGLKRAAVRADRYRLREALDALQDLARAATALERELATLS